MGSATVSGCAACKIKPTAALEPGVADALRLARHRHNQVFGLHQALCNSLDVLDRYGFDLAIAPVDIIDAEIIEL